MEFTSQTTLASDVDETFRAARDHLGKLGAQMPSITAFEPVAWRHVAGDVERVDRWSARVAPVALAGVQLSTAVWVVTSRWNAATHRALWHVTVLQPEDSARCHGAIEMTACPQGTKATIRGRVRVDLNAAGIRLGPLGGSVRSVAESMLARLIRHNLSQLFQALQHDTVAARRVA